MNTLIPKKNQYEVIPIILGVILKTTNPIKIVLFGSCARRCITQYSDIDLCILLKDEITVKERIELRTELLKRLAKLIDFEVDIFICSIEDWEKNHKNKGTFIGKISDEGEIIYGR